MDPGRDRRARGQRGGGRGRGNARAGRAGVGAQPVLRAGAAAHVLHAHAGRDRRRAGEVRGAGAAAAPAVPRRGRPLARLPRVPAVLRHARVPRRRDGEPPQLARVAALHGRVRESGGGERRGGRRRGRS